MESSTRTPTDVKSCLEKGYFVSIDLSLSKSSKKQIFEVTKLGFLIFKQNNLKKVFEEWLSLRANYGYQLTSKKVLLLNSLLLF